MEAPEAAGGSLLSLLTRLAPASMKVKLADARKLLRLSGVATVEEEDVISLEVPVPVEGTSFDICSSHASLRSRDRASSSLIITFLLLF